MVSIKKPTISLANLRKLKLPKREVDIWNFERLLEEFNLSLMDIDSEKFDASKFSMFEIYDNHHRSDESSNRYLVYFDGKPSCIIGYTGDRGTPYSGFFSKEAALELYRYFSSLRSFSFDVLEEQENLDDSYTRLVFMNDTLYYQLDSPKWGHLDTKKPMFRLEDDDTLTPIKFVKFKTAKESWEEKDDDKFIIALVDGREEEVPYYRLLTKQSL